MNERTSAGGVRRVLLARLGEGLFEFRVGRRSEFVARQTPHGLFKYMEMVSLILEDMTTTDSTHLAAALDRFGAVALHHDDRDHADSEHGHESDPVRQRVLHALVRVAERLVKVPGMSRASACTYRLNRQQTPVKHSLEGLLVGDAVEVVLLAALRVRQHSVG